MRDPPVAGILDFSQIMTRNPLATFVVDAQHRIVMWNPACAALTGLSAEDMLGSNEHWRAFYETPRPLLLDLIVDGVAMADIERHYPDRCRRSALIEGALEVEDFVVRFPPSGRWIFATAAPILDARGRVTGAIETLQDVTARRQAEAALRDSEAYLAQIVEGSPVATFVIDAAHRVSHWNRACEVLTGRAARDVLGTRDQWHPFYAEKRPTMADLVLDGAVEGRIDALYPGRQRPSMLVPGAYEAEDYFPHFGVGGRWLFFTAAPIRNVDGTVVGAIETLQDITERHRAEEALRESEERYRLLSQTDALTGLFNSRHLQERLQQEVERAGRYVRPFSLLVLDCDRFKRINDTYGHLEGDKVLQALAAVMTNGQRRSDSSYRYGGEEFVVLMPETGADAALVLAERLREEFAGTVIQASNGASMHCTVSIGVASYLSGDTESSLLRRADEACYAAKRLGRNCVVADGQSC